MPARQKLNTNILINVTSLRNWQGDNSTGKILGQQMIYSRGLLLTWRIYTFLAYYPSDSPPKHTFGSCDETNPYISGCLAFVSLESLSLQPLKQTSPSLLTLVLRTTLHTTSCRCYPDRLKSGECLINDCLLPFFG